MQPGKNKRSITLMNKDVLNVFKYIKFFIILGVITDRGLVSTV
jgi:hypothetical protein